jgi:hypothetical protein
VLGLHSATSDDTTPRMVGTCLPSSVQFSYVTMDEQERRVCIPMPANMPHPTSPEYQQFLTAYFTGKVQGAEKHNWTTELSLCQDPRGAEKQSKDPALSVWQALGYIHARKVIESDEMHGNLFWWTPGSGKSIMVSLLLELLYDTDRPIYVVSTPQNTRQNGLRECVRAMLRFSPRFNVGDREPTVEDEENLLRLFRKRKPPVFMGNFMTFRVFTSKCMQKPSMLEGAAVIIDESHELFNPKVCERHNMWEHVLERLCNDPKSKVFTFSGTPGRNMREVLLQVELVRFAHERTNLASLERGEGWRERLAAYTRGRVSYVDGAMDRSRFPVNMTHETAVCELSDQQFINVGDRSHKLLTNLQFSGFKEMVDAVSDEKTRKTALPSMRLAQVCMSCICAALKHSVLHHTCNCKNTYDAYIHDIIILLPRLPPRAFGDARSTDCAQSCRRLSSGSRARSESRTTSQAATTTTTALRTKRMRRCLIQKTRLMYLSGPIT